MSSQELYFSIITVSYVTYKKYINYLHGVWF